MEKHGLLTNLVRTLILAGVLGAASGAGYLFSLAGFPDVNIVIVYLLAVLVVAWLTRNVVWGLVSSAMATFLFNYFFVSPTFAFGVEDPSYLITFVIMTCAALLTGTLTSHAKRNERLAREREAETKAVYNLTNHLTDAPDLPAIAATATAAVSASFGCGAACLCFDDAGRPEPTFLQQQENGKQVHRRLEDGEGLRHALEGLRSGRAVGEEFHDWPIYGSECILGALRIPRAAAEKMNGAQESLLRSMAETTALAMDRFRSAEQRLLSREETARERYRANLLRAISHDLRTPLSGIIGTSEMLMGMTDRDDPRYAMARDIRGDADWLRSLMENILNLTRLQDGGLALNKQPEAVEEVVGEAARHMADRRPDREISVSVPEELLLVPMDARLIQQVLLNLLDNAVKHTEAQAEISLTVRRRGDSVLFAVRDRGNGIPAGDLERIFEAFYTGRGNRLESGKGIGLGLAICDTIVRAHGGTIRARNRADGPGAEFTFTLPLEEVDP